MSESDLWRAIRRLEADLNNMRSFEVPKTFKWQNWTPTLTGWSANPTNCVYRYMLVGKTCFFSIRQVTAGTSDAATLTITAPFTAVTITNQLWLMPALVQDAGGATTWGRCRIPSGENIFYFGLTAAADAGFTASGNKRVAACEGWYEVAG